jgi:hypothetical protein
MLTKKQAKARARQWLKERCVGEYGKQFDSLRLGWRVYCNTKGQIIYIEPVDWEYERQMEAGRGLA